MAISEDIRAKILRYFHVEKWRVGTIARQLGVHHTTVERIIAETGAPKEKALRQSIITPYLPFIMETFDKYPGLNSRRIYDMVYERGYRGHPDHFRHLIAIYRPKPAAEAYLRLRTLPGEQAQIDWGDFGYVTIGKAKRKLMGFVMTLSYSRKRFLKFFLNARMENFLRGHVDALNFFNGSVRVILYDNLRSLVLGRQGSAIHFNPTMLTFAAHYRYEPRPVAPARGNEKGRVERTIGFIRTSFFAAREWDGINDLNTQAIAWCNGLAADRPCPEQPEITVREAFEQELPSLISLPDNPFDTDEIVEVKVGKTPYVRFDLNDYSVPHNYVRRKLTIAATLDKISILSG
ncbi:MAG: IS21 family transposase, partial [Candidatus Saccharimonadales bacterium]